ncbi:hypothetical protein B0T22DRAFT_441374 [Podospora appendiculata]|uniref:Uncharacterized protein n=1 Tax=Podospora appendiculata TaxID=314037 RepID=A0AAE0XCH9_9PEZI|nr:hypothetical protein B0T22DRAFT_441374 [Podospora appendiculata]
MWALADETSNIRTLTVSNLAGSIDGAKFEAPEISLNIIDRTKPIYYYLNFKSGTLKVSKNSKQHPDNTTADFNIAGWSVCFPAQISSTLYIASLSKFGDVDWTKQPTVIRKNFKSFMSQWLTDMADDQKTVVGYSVVDADGASVNAHAPTFPPTAVDHCNYPWRDPSNSANLKTNKNDKDSLPENGFCYLITTQSKFWGDWLLTANLLRKLARGTEMVPTAPYIEDVTYNYRGYAASDGDSYFAFTDDGLQWAWNEKLLSASDSVYVPTASKTAYAEETGFETSLVKVTFVAGGQRIFVTGSNWFNMRCRWSSGD